MLLIGVCLLLLRWLRYTSEWIILCHWMLLVVLWLRISIAYQLLCILLMLILLLIATWREVGTFAAQMLLCRVVALEELGDWRLLKLLIPLLLAVNLTDLSIILLTLELIMKIGRYLHLMLRLKRSFCASIGLETLKDVMSCRYSTSRTLFTRSTIQKWPTNLISACLNNFTLLRIFMPHVCFRSLTIDLELL